jgi:hypothetical protein
MEAVMFVVVMVLLLSAATLYKPHMREPDTPSQRCRANQCPCRDTSNRTTGGSSHG